MRNLLTLSFIFCFNFSFCQTFYLFIGTYTDSGSKGIYVYKFDATSGKAVWVSNTDSVVNPSYLTVSNDHKNIYAVNETNHATPGAVSSFAFDQKAGTLKFINKQESGGDDPCYISITKNKKWVVVANYSGGSVAALPLNKDGSLKRYAQLIQDSGKSINADRQEGPHVHSAVFSPDEKFVFTPNLGTDKIMEYHFDANKTYPLSPAKPAYTSTIAGSGPRHFTFSPDHTHAYLMQEMSGTVNVYTYSENKTQHGKLKLIQSIITHPQNYKGLPGSADIHVSPDGNYLYASNRGEENTITIFSINKTTGKLLLKGYSQCGGKTPRNFIIDPSGNYLLAANQNSNNIAIFKRNKLTGLLTPTNEEIKVPKPVCLQMIKY